MGEGSVDQVDKSLSISLNQDDNENNTMVLWWVSRMSKLMNETWQRNLWLRSPNDHQSRAALWPCESWRHLCFIIIPAKIFWLYQGPSHTKFQWVCLIVMNTFWSFLMILFRCLIAWSQLFGLPTWSLLLILPQEEQLFLDLARLARCLAHANIMVLTKVTGVCPWLLRNAALDLKYLKFYSNKINEKL